MDRVVTKVRELGFNDTADNLEENRDRFKQFLIRHNWTEAVMACHKWDTGKWNEHIYGKKKGDDLVKIKGVKIIPNIGVYIAYFDQDGWFTRPRIYCSAGEF